MPHGPGPLDGVKVLDFSRVYSGPFCGRALADLGADVVKVEPPAGDLSRFLGARSASMSLYHAQQNAGKRNISLDLNRPEARTLLLRLAEQTDIVLENFRPGVMDRFGLGYDAIAAVNPRVVYASLTGWGQEGPWRNRRAYAVIVHAEAGLTSGIIDRGGDARNDGYSHADVYAGLECTIGILAALHHRDHSGEGQQIEINLLSSALSALVNQTSAYVAGGVVPNRMGNAHLSLYPYEPMATGDGELIIAAGNDRQFRKLVEALGAPHLADDERFATVLARNDNRALLAPLLLEKLATKSAQEWFHILSDVGVPCGPINDVHGGVQLAESLGLEPVVAAGAVSTIRNPIRMSQTPPRYQLAPPSIGEHSAEIRDWLGFGKATR